MTHRERQILSLKIRREERVKGRILAFQRFLLLCMIAAAPIGLVVAHFKTAQLGWFTCGLMIFAGGLFILFFWADVRECNVKIAGLHATAEANEMDVVRCQANDMVEFEEIDDEGATYAFQVEANQLWIVTGQEFYSKRNFPSTDFEIATSRGRTPFPAILRIASHGKKLSPARIISVETIRKLRIPTHSELLTGRLEDLEQLLEETDN